MAKAIGALVGELDPPTSSTVTATAVAAPTPVRIRGDAVSTAAIKPAERCTAARPELINALLILVRHLRRCGDRHTGRVEFGSATRRDGTPRARTDRHRQP